MAKASLVRFNHIPEVIAALPRAAEEYNMAALTLLRGDAQVLAPKKTGRLRAEHVLNFSTPGVPSLDVLTPYAAHVHYGTYKMAARPWLQWAVDQNRASYQGNVGRIVDRVFANLGP